MHGHRITMERVSSASLAFRVASYRPHAIDNLLRNFDTDSLTVELGGSPDLGSAIGKSLHATIQGMAADLAAKNVTIGDQSRMLIHQANFLVKETGNNVDLANPYPTSGFRSRNRR